jgi:hypothetical protein
MLIDVTFRLPFPDVWFVIWFSDGGGIRYETVNMLHAVEFAYISVQVMTISVALERPARWATGRKLQFNLCGIQSLVGVQSPRRGSLRIVDTPSGRPTHRWPSQT